MIKQNLKFILRSSWKRRMYSLIILLSLTVGFVCTNMLIAFIIRENNTDTFHTRHEKIFQVFSNDPFGGNGLVTYIPDYFYDYLTANYAEVEQVCQIGGLDGISLENSKAKFDDVKVLSVDSSFFTLFDFRLAQGTKADCLTPGKIVVTQDKAVVLFGSTDVVGKLIALTTPDTTMALTVSAVVERPVENSHLYFDALVHHATYPEKWNGGATYALLGSRDSREVLANKINKDNQRPGLIGLGKMTYFLNPLTDSYFNTDNKLGFMRTRNPMLLSVAYGVCGLVLFIASFNFINLFLLSWQDRRKEIGIKKTLGVTRGALFSFSLTETAVYVLTAFLLSLVLTVYAIPIFNQVFEANLSPQYFLNVKVIAFVCSIVFLIAALVVILSVSKQWHVKPISLMTNESSRMRFSRLLFTIQFVISITLSICSVTIVRQMNYLESAPLGFNRHIVQVNAPDKKYADALSVLKQKIILLSNVNNVAVSSGNPIFGNMVVRYDLDNERFYTPFLFSGDEDYLKTLDLELIDGELPFEKNQGKLVNETLVRHFNMKKPVGELVPGTKDVIVGVVKDFTCGSFKQEIPPAIISYNTNGQSLLIDYSGSDLASLLPKIQAEWQKLFPDFTFGYRVLQEELMKKYKEDIFFHKIIITFSVISIVLSSFGLFALSWAVVQNRTKEMGIRKVLGATPLDILNLLTITFTKRIILAFMIAAPIGYYFMDQWLARFVNKIEINGWIYVIAALIVTIVAFITLSVQTVKATLTNPVDEIRMQ